MTDPKEFESLDELFRKTFDRLPETPAPSGWDTPSDRVWQFVQSEITPPRSGWTLKSIALIASFAVTLAIGLYLFLNRQKPVEIPANETPAVVETPAKQNTTAGTPLMENQSEKRDGRLTVPARPARKKSGAENTRQEGNIPSPRSTQAAESASGASLHEHAARSTDKKPVSPNSTERRKAELARRAETAWKTPLAPLSPHWPKLKPVDPGH